MYLIILFLLSLQIVCIHVFSVSAPWAPSRVDMCALQIFIFIIIIIIIIIISADVLTSRPPSLPARIYNNSRFL